MQTLSTQNPFKLIGQNKVGLLTPSLSYTVERYPWAYEYWKRQQQVHWLGEEVPMSSDIKDWHSDHLSSQEKHLLTQIFRFFTQSDIEVGENYLKRYIPIFQPLEIRLMMCAFSNMETIHIDAYALLLKTLGMPASEFEAFRDYEAMANKADYMQSFSIHTCADVARTLAMFGAFTEGVSLFASFAILLNFPRFNKMKGMGQIISWSVRDESLHAQALIRLYHEWHTETGAVNQAVKADIIDVAKTVVALEDKFIELAFELGSVEGLSATEVKQYIRFVTDYRLSQLKLEPLYGYYAPQAENYTQLKPHPLPWLLEILNGVEHTNFFEQRATEYSKASTQGQWQGKQGVWEIFEQEKRLG